MPNNRTPARPIRQPAYNADADAATVINVFMVALALGSIVYVVARYIG